jgi:outer membrane protein OmpA-like peptidoglycan-associated protein
MFAVLAAMLLGGCLLQGTKPTGPPPPERERSISTGADAQRIARARIRIAAQRGGAAMAKAYHLAKADAWLDFAADAGRNEAGADAAEDALDQAELLIGALERGRTPPLRTLHVAASSSIREDLWAAVDGMKNSAAFPCAGAPLARAEVALVWAGHKAFIGDATAADEIAARAHAYLDDTRSEAARCLTVGESPPAQREKPPPAQPTVVTSAPTVAPTPAPTAAPASTSAPASPAAVPGPVGRPSIDEAPANPRIERVQLPTDSLFPFGATRLDPARSESLRDLAQRIRLIPDVVAVRIHGHTDRLSRSGSGYNQRLSASRARAVGKALVAHGVSPGLIDARGHGDTIPLVACPGPRNKATIDCLAPNRRVDIEIERVL